MSDTLSKSAEPRFPIDGVTYRLSADVGALLDSGAWSVHGVADAVRQAAQTDPDGEALVDPAVRMTWSELNERSDRLAAGLLARGISPGDRVLTQLGVGVDTVLAFVALFKAGIVPVCAVPQYRELEMNALCERSQAVAHIVSSSETLLDLAERLRERHTHLRHVFTCGPNSRGATTLTELEATSHDDTVALTDRVAPSAADVIAFQLSGGTSDVPKIIPRFHGEYAACCAAMAQRFELTASDRVLWTMSLSHNAGMMLVMIPCLLSRSTLVLADKFDPAQFLKTIETERITFAGSVGPITPRLLEMDDIESYDLSSMRYFFTIARAADLEAHLGVRVGCVYGITEGLLMGSGPSDSEEVRHNTVGHLLSTADVAVLLDPGPSPDGRKDVQGELAFGGASVLTAYFADPKATAAAFSTEGYLRTGDVVTERVIDGVRCFIYNGRFKENIDRGGEKFGTGAIEALLAEHPAILEARVVGMPDQVLGERVCAYVILKPSEPLPSVDDVASFLLARGLAKFKIPDRIERLDRFPETAVGKEDRPALRRMIADTLSSENASNA